MSLVLAGIVTVEPVPSNSSRPEYSSLSLPLTLTLSSKNCQGGSCRLSWKSNGWHLLGWELPRGGCPKGTFAGGSCPWSGGINCLRRSRPITVEPCLPSRQLDCKKHITCDGWLVVNSSKCSYCHSPKHWPPGNVWLGPLEVISCLSISIIKGHVIITTDPAMRGEVLNAFSMNHALWLWCFQLSYIYICAPGLLMRHDKVL